MKKSILLYGVLMAVLLIVLQVVEYRYAIQDIPTSALIGILALIFISIGIWVGTRLGRKDPPVNPDIKRENISKRLNLLNISDREYEVLQLINEGCSNQEIADRLFISISTVKTHASKIFSKLGVQRRTQVIQKSKELDLV